MIIHQWHRDQEVNTTAFLAVLSREAELRCNISLSSLDVFSSALLQERVKNNFRPIIQTIFLNCYVHQKANFMVKSHLS